MGGAVKAITSIFSPKVPKPAALPTPPSEDPAAKQKAEDAAKAQRLASGRQSTILTGGTGLDDSELNLSKLLLG